MNKKDIQIIINMLLAIGLLYITFVLFGFVIVTVIIIIIVGYILYLYNKLLGNFYKKGLVKYILKIQKNNNKRYTKEDLYKKDTITLIKIRNNLLGK